MNKLKTYLLLPGALLFFSLINLSSSNSLDSIHVPCSFIDTVNLTDYEKFPNGSFLYEGLIIPPNLWGIFEYTSNDLSERIAVKPHVRGCICKQRPCVKFCCSTTAARSSGTFCEEFEEKNNSSTLLMNITTSLGVVREVDLAKNFSFQYGRPCASMYLLTPHWNDNDFFSLFDNGTLFLRAHQVYLSKDQFCLTAYSDNNTTDIILPMNCYHDDNNDAMIVVYGWTMAFSVPFMVLTIIIYLAIPELRTLNGKSLCCYLFGLCCGYSILSVLLLMPSQSISNLQCKVFGFFAYFSFMASFFWLSVISFDLFYKFYNMRAPRAGINNKKKRFILYSIYAWGLALISLCLTYAAQQSSIIPDEWKPAIGSDEWCWLNVSNGWSAMIYFFGPIIIIICFNIIMFILTALKIHEAQKHMNRVMESNDSQKNLRTERDRFVVFFRLFIVMGVTWSMEVITYLIGANSAWQKLFYITDFVNGIQGFLIFALFVLKKTVKQYIYNRYMSISCSEFQTQCTNNSTSANIYLPMNVIGADKPLMDKIVKTES